MSGDHLFDPESQFAATAHGKLEVRTGKADPNWLDWYAGYVVREQFGEDLPQ
jgi:hypothetical protein